MAGDIAAVGLHKDYVCAAFGGDSLQLLDQPRCDALTTVLGRHGEVVDVDFTALGETLAASLIFPPPPPPFRLRDASSVAQPLESAGTFEAASLPSKRHFDRLRRITTSSASSSASSLRCNPSRGRYPIFSSTSAMASARRPCRRRDSIVAAPSRISAARRAPCFSTRSIGSGRNAASRDPEKSG